MLIPQETPLERTPLPLRTSNALRRAGILTVGQLQEYTPELLSHIHGFGKVGQEKVRKLLKE